MKRTVCVLKAYPPIHQQKTVAIIHTEAGVERIVWMDGVGIGKLEQLRADCIVLNTRSHGQRVTGLELFRNGLAKRGGVAGSPAGGGQNCTVL